MGDERADDPVWGTPPAPRSSLDPLPAPGSPSSPPVADRLLTADAFAVIERSGFMTGRSYELVGMDGATLGHLSEQTSTGSWFFGSAMSSTFTLLDASGGLIAQMLRPGSMGRFRFIVSGPDGQQAGTVEQENTIFAPQFTLAASDGSLLRLTGGSFGSTDWALVDTRDDGVVGRVSQEYSHISGILGGTQRFTVRLSPLLDGPSRLLAVMTTACLDYVRDAKKRR